MADTLAIDIIAADMASEVIKDVVSNLKDLADTLGALGPVATGAAAALGAVFAALAAGVSIAADNQVAMAKISAVQSAVADSYAADTQRIAEGTANAGTTTKESASKLESWTNQLQNNDDAMVRNQDTLNKYNQQLYDNYNGIANAGLAHDAMLHNIEHLQHQLEQESRTHDELSDKIAHGSEEVSTFTEKLGPVPAAVSLTTDQLGAMAQQMADTTRFTRVQTEEAIALGLTFTNISGKQFPEFLDMAAGVAEVTGRDLTTTMRVLGRALDDPAQGMGALSRAGIVLDTSTKEMIKTMEKHGDLVGAQTVLIRELEGRYDGAAEAVGKTFTGQVDIASHHLQDLGITLGDQLLPALTEVINGVNAFLRNPVLEQFVEQFGQFFANIVQGISDNVGPILEGFGNLFGLIIIPAITNLASVVGTVLGPAFQSFGDIFSPIKTMMDQFNLLLQDGLGPLDALHGALYRALGPDSRDLLLQIFGTLQKITESFGIFQQAIQNGLEPLDALRIAISHAFGPEGVALFDHVKFVITDIVNALMALAHGDFDTFFANIGDLFKSVDWDKVKSGLLTGLQNLGDVGMQIFNWLKAQLQKVDWSKVWDTIQVVAGNVFEFVGSATDAISKMVTGFLNGVDWEMVIHVAAGIIGTGLQGLGDIIGDLLTGIAGEGSTSGTDTSFAHGHRATGTNSIATRIGEQISAELSHIDWEKVGEGVVVDGGKLMTGLGKVINAALGGLGGALGSQIKLKIPISLEDIFGKPEDAPSRGSVGSAFGNIFQSLFQREMGIQAGGPDSIQYMITARIKDAIDGVSKDQGLHDAFFSMLDGLFGKAPAEPIAGGAAIGGINPFINIIKGFINDPNIATTLTGFWTNIQNAIKTPTDNIKTMINGISTTISTTFHSAVDGVEKIWSTLITDFNTVTGLMQKDVPAALDALSQKVKDVTDPILAFLNNVIAPLLQAFQDISGVLDDLIQKVKDFGDALANLKVPDFLQSHSPPPLQTALEGILKSATDLTAHLPVLAGALAQIKAHNILDVQNVLAHMSQSQFETSVLGPLNRFLPAGSDKDALIQAILKYMHDLGIPTGNTWTPGGPTVNPGGTIQRASGDHHIHVANMYVYPKSYDDFLRIIKDKTDIHTRMGDTF